VILSGLAATYLEDLLDQVGCFWGSGVKCYVGPSYDLAYPCAVRAPMWRALLPSLKSFHHTRCITLAGSVSDISDDLLHCRLLLRLATCQPQLTL
jgi:hypothetical protein